MERCVVCAAEFEPKRKTSVLCGDPACRRRRKTDWQLAWQLDNAKKHAQYTKITRQRWPDRRRANRAREAGRKRAAEYGCEHENYSADDLLALLPQGCYVCGGHDGPIGWDHVVPLAELGPDALRNIKPCHWHPCHTSLHRGRPPIRRR